MSADPLSFFAGESSSSSESEGEEDRPDSEDSGIEKAPPPGQKLPSPDSLFASVGVPTFLNNPAHPDINWDKFVRNETDPEEPNIHLTGDGNYVAIAPPTDLGENTSKHNKKVHSALSAAIISTYSTTEGEISAPPVRYTTKDVDPKFRTVSDAGEDAAEETSGASLAGTKHLSSSSTGPQSEAKKSKTENFRQKEKRKRNMGQTSRGKNYVEEEKRVLRQHFSTDEIMS